jgi:hypothetical protein
LRQDQFTNAQTHNGGLVLPSTRVTIVVTEVTSAIPGERVFKEQYKKEYILMQGQTLSDTLHVDPNTPWVIVTVVPAEGGPRGNVLRVYQ